MVALVILSNTISPQNYGWLKGNFTGIFTNKKERNTRSSHKHQWVFIVFFSNTQRLYKHKIKSKSFKNHCNHSVITKDNFFVTFIKTFAKFLASKLANKFKKQFSQSLSHYSAPLLSGMSKQKMIENRFGKKIGGKILSESIFPTPLLLQLDIFLELFFL